MPPNRLTELRTAFEWTCDDCGGDNFARAIQLEPEQALALVPDDTRAEVEGTEGGWCIKPDLVVCSHCGSTYETTDCR